MDDFEGIFEKEINRFICTKCHIKLNYAILYERGKDMVISHEDQTC